ncbi:hypothetical protein [Pseudotabrizicola sp. L79]|uniref:hypothetical protein n=1 Tax=Pseudotabrizicola sp. L79 TaxID=3118402 RepID=UPI002F92C719
MKEEVIDKRSVLGLASFFGLILALALSVPFTLDRAQPNQPLTSAVAAWMN